MEWIMGKLKKWVSKVLEIRECVTNILFYFIKDKW